MERWAELRTAYVVARRGTVTAAAEELGVHRATVTRHIEALEADLGAKMFQRHARGYALTEVGRELLSVAGRAEALIADFAGRTRARAAEAGGAITVTALVELGAALAPAFAAFRAKNPAAIVTFVADEARLRLERGEAQVAVRAGPRPTEPDYVVQRLAPLRFALYASRAYLAERGAPDDGDDFSGHAFIGVDVARKRPPFARWLERRAPESAVGLLASDAASTRAAVRAGMGLGFLPEPEAALDPELVEIRAPRRDWSVRLWLLSHVDLHRTRLVQAMCAEVKAALGANGKA